MKYLNIAIFFSSKALAISVFNMNKIQHVLYMYVGMCRLMYAYVCLCVCVLLKLYIIQSIEKQWNFVWF